MGLPFFYQPVQMAKQTKGRLKDHFWAAADGKVTHARVIHVYDIPKSTRELRHTEVMPAPTAPVDATAFAWGDLSDGSLLLAHTLLWQVAKHKAADRYNDFCRFCIRKLSPTWTLNVADIKQWLKLSKSQARQVLKYEELGFMAQDWDKNPFNSKEYRVRFTRKADSLKVTISRDGRINKVEAEPHLIDPNDPLRINRYPFVVYSDGLVEVLLEKIGPEDIRVNVLRDRQLIRSSHAYKTFSGALKCAEKWANESHRYRAVR